MNKLLFGCCSLPLALSAAPALAGEPDGAKTPGAEEPAAPEAPAPPEATPRASSAELGIIVVPWGMAYTRSGFGMTARYKVPLVQRPGVLWDKTNVTFSLREFYGYTNNSLGASVEVTPIGFFKLQLFAAYDNLIVNPFSGGVRVLTPVGRQKLADGAVERGNPTAVDWVEGKDNHDIFYGPVPGDGLRLKIQPTLQAKIGPVGLQYNFTADFNFYRAGDWDHDAIYHDTFTFTLRKMRDRGYVNEVIAVYEVPGISDEIRAGVTGKHYYVDGTGLDTLAVNALGFYRPGYRWLDDRLSPWIGAQVGTNLIDPMHRYSFSWVLAFGLDLRLVDATPAEPPGAAACMDDGRPCLLGTSRVEAT